MLKYCSPLQLDMRNSRKRPPAAVSLLLYCFNTTIALYCFKMKQ